MKFNKEKCKDMVKKNTTTSYSPSENHGLMRVLMKKIKGSSLNVFH